MIRFRFPAAGVVILLATVTAPAFAAPPGGAGSAAQGDLIKKLNGTLEQIQRNALIVKDKEGTEFTVGYPDKATLMIFQGKAVAGFLRPGMLVRTRVRFNGQGQAMTPVKKLEVISALSAKVVPHHQINRYRPGVNSVDRKIKPPMPGEYYVVGQLANLAGGYVAIQAGNVPLRLPVDPAGVIELTLHDLTMAAKGDRVTVQGFYAESTPTMIKADSIRVLPDRVFGETPEKKPRSRRSRRNKSKDAEVEAEKPSEG